MLPWYERLVPSLTWKTMLVRVQPDVPEHLTYITVVDIIDLKFNSLLAREPPGVIRIVFRGYT